jgi:hypothetical protein
MQQEDPHRPAPTVSSAPPVLGAKPEVQYFVRVNADDANAVRGHGTRVEIGDFANADSGAFNDSEHRRRSRCSWV